MDEPVGDVLQRELLATGPEVALSVPITLEVAVDGAHQSEASNVELPVLVQKRLLNVLLDDVRSLGTIHNSILDEVLDVVQVFTHLDTAATVGVLSWFHDPELFAELAQRVQDGLLVWVKRLMIQLLELEELRIVQTLLDMESKWQMVVVLFADGLVIYFHIIKDGFLVGQMVVILHLGVHQATMRCMVLLLLLFLLVTFLATASNPVLLSTVAGSSTVLLPHDQL